MTSHTTRTFKLPMTTEQAVDFIETFHRNEVEQYGREFFLTEDCKNNLRKIAKFLTENTLKWGLFITGRTGNGKTTLLKALTNLVNYLITEEYIERDENYSNCFKIVGASEVVRLFVEKRDDYYKLQKRENLLIDDVGDDAFEVVIYGVPYHPLLDLLMDRYANHRFTIISSNLTADEIKAKYHDVRLSDRLREMFLGVSFNDKSFR